MLIKKFGTSALRINGNNMNKNTLQQAIQPFINDSKWPQLAMSAFQQDYYFKSLEIARFYQL